MGISALSGQISHRVRAHIHTSLFGRRSAFSLVQNNLKKSLGLRTYAPTGAGQKKFCVHLPPAKSWKYHFWTFHFFDFSNFIFLEKNCENIFWKCFEKIVIYLFIFVLKNLRFFFLNFFWRIVENFFCRCVDAHLGAVFRSGEDAHLCRSVGVYTLPREGVNLRRGVGLMRRCGDQIALLGSHPNNLYYYRTWCEWAYSGVSRPLVRDSRSACLKTKHYL